MPTVRSMYLIQEQHDNIWESVAPAFKTTTEEAVAALARWTEQEPTRSYRLFNLTTGVVIDSAPMSGYHKGKTRWRMEPVAAAVAGETVLLNERGTLRWVRIVLASPVRTDGTQMVSVQHCDQYGRSKPRPVKLGSNAKIEWVS